MYKIYYSPRSAKVFKKLPKNYQLKIKARVSELSKNPLTFGTIKLVDYTAAKYRNRIGNYRILFDLDENRKLLEIIDIRKRDEKTYR